MVLSIHGLANHPFIMFVMVLVRYTSNNLKVCIDKMIIESGVELDAVCLFRLLRRVDMIVIL
jgi:hypothetical protein